MKLMIKSKRAVSALVATVLVILITLAAFGVVYAYIMPLISSGMETSQACSDVKVSVNTHKGYTCFDSTTGEVRLQVSRENDEQNVTELQLKLGKGGESTTINIVDELGDSVPDTNAEKVYEISDTTVPTLASLGLGDGVDSASVAAVVKIGNKEHVCSMTSDVVVPECD